MESIKIKFNPSLTVCDVRVSRRDKKYWNNYRSFDTRENEKFNGAISADFFENLKISLGDAINEVTLKLWEPGDKTACLQCIEVTSFDAYGGRLRYEYGFATTVTADEFHIKPYCEFHLVMPEPVKGIELGQQYIVTISSVNQ